MTYLTKEDFLERLGETELVSLTDKKGDGEVDVDNLAKSIAYAEVQFNARVLPRYLVPATIPLWMKTLLLDMAVYDLYKDQEFDEGVWKVKKVAHDDAIKFLTAVGNGNAVLDLELVPPVGAEGGSFAGELPGTVSVILRPGWG